MHVLLIHQAFAGPDDPGGTRHYELGSSLVAHGHRVTVIASAVNYLTGTRARGGDEGVPDGMRIVRIPLRENLHRSYWARTTSFFAFARAAARVARAVKGVDVVWGTSPPLVQLLPAWLASRRCPGGLVFEERDLWPEFAIAMGVVRDGPVAKAALAFKRLMYARARRVVINSPGFLQFLRGYGVPDAKVRVVPNGVDIQQFRPEDRGETFRREWEADERFVVLYAGALGPANALETVLDAADALRGTPALFVLAGDGKARPELEQAAAARALTNVRFVPAQPKRAVPQLIAAADACLATLRDIPLFRTTYPNKVFDYMAAGRAVLLGIDGVIRDVVERAHGGLFFTPGDGNALAGRVREMMRDPAGVRVMGDRGRRAVCDAFDRRLQAAQIEDLFTSLLSGHRTSDPPMPPRHQLRRVIFSAATARAAISRTFRRRAA
jgi:glycosyltransferase involved in cell wall biosynthesis